MRLSTSNLNQIKKEFPSITFVQSDSFKWLPEEQTIHYVDEADSFEHLLHELSHAQLNHRAYVNDIALLAMEREAWEYAVQQLAPRYKITISESLLQDDLDSYRDWLHARSTCPKCSATGIQISVKQYSCVVCQHEWTVNQAIDTNLRRYHKK